jgi:protein-disulfide isomerase
MGKNLKSSLVMTLIAGLGLAGLAVLARVNSEPADVTAATAQPLVRANSHRLSTAPDGKVTFVQFTDFECEACLSVHPAIEQLRKDYDGRVTFVVKYFPLDGHFNSERAARAVEAAAQQGEFEAMYQRMYATQTEWGEQQTPADETFRGFADDLELDLAKFDTAYDHPATLERIQQDLADGQKAGVESTPTFFVNGERLDPRTYEDFTTALDAALSS